MNLLTIFLQAQGGGMQMIIMMVAIFAIMYFFMIRPQNKKQKEIQKFRDSIAPGMDIVTAGGIYGKVKEVNELDNTLMIEVASGVKIKIAKKFCICRTADRRCCRQIIIMDFIQIKKYYIIVKNFLLGSKTRNS